MKRKIFILSKKIQISVLAFVIRVKNYSDMLDALSASKANESKMILSTRINFQLKMLKIKLS